VGDFEMIGAWQSSLISLLVILSIVLGLIIYWIGKIGNFRIAESFVGGEKWGNQAGFKVTGFYDTIRNAAGLKFMFRHAEKRHFDLYDLAAGIVLFFNNLFSKAHTGVLSHYAIWFIVGLVVMLIILL